MKSVYIICVLGELGRPEYFATGGGSSTKASIKAHETEESAKRSMNQLNKRPMYEGERLGIVEFKADLKSPVTLFHSL